MQETLDVPNEVAAELAGIGDGVLTALRERLDCKVNLRGNSLTLEGDQGKVAEARTVVEELVELVESGQAIGAGTVDTIVRAIDQSEDVREIFDDVIWSHRGKRWRNCGWKQLPETKLYGEYGLVNLVGLIPSLASQTT